MYLLIIWPLKGFHRPPYPMAEQKIWSTDRLALSEGKGTTAAVPPSSGRRTLVEKDESVFLYLECMWNFPVEG